MSDTHMPATEADVAPETTETVDPSSYELAFHVLPTVAEGEVPAVLAALKDMVTAVGGTIVAEEAPQRFDLAYEITKPIEGKNRKFQSAYFGWVRCLVPAEGVATLATEVEAHPSILRSLLIKLTKVEEAHPFFCHEALAAEKMESTAEESTVVPDVTTVKDTEAPTEAAAEEKEEKTEAETTKPVDNEELDEALKKEEA